jgi:hypothetical protein
MQFSSPLCSPCKSYLSGTNSPWNGLFSNITFAWERWFTDYISHPNYSHEYDITFLCPLELCWESFHRIYIYVCLLWWLVCTTTICCSVLNFCWFHPQCETQYYLSDNGTVTATTLLLFLANVCSCIPGFSSVLNSFWHGICLSRGTVSYMKLFLRIVFHFHTTCPSAASIHSDNTLHLPWHCTIKIISSVLY